MMSMKSLILCAALLVSVFAPGFASAQPVVDASQGGLVRLNRDHFWSMKRAPDVTLSDVEKLSDDLRAPSISPDGRTVLLSHRTTEPGDTARLYQWRAESKTPDLILEHQDVSDYVTWTGKDTFYMREQSAPFARTGSKLNFTASAKRPRFLDKRVINENPVIVFDEEDVIIMQRNGVVQAISDVTIDRYFAPQVSQDEKFVVFSGLTTGVNLFDIARNTVVFQDRYGSEPRFSADGKYLIYAETSDDGHVYKHGDIIVVDLGSQTKMRLANPKREIRLRATLSNDAGFVAYETVNGETYRARLVK